jgi:hypothetical protein
VWSNGVVAGTPPFDQYINFQRRVKELATLEFITGLAVECPHFPKADVQMPENE